MTTPLTAYSTLEDCLNATQYTLECNCTERLFLWREHNKTVTWEQKNGYMVTVGQFADMPVVVSVLFNVINGHVVMFYEAVSQVVDHRMVTKWLEEKVPVIKAKGRLGHNSDAGNFHTCLRALKALDVASAEAVPA